ncbi:MAG: 50S ribosomal protein L24 [Candidatus Dadabacteria bacterium]|nr:50S ribosomal protein L24 [Candidatus Dadabacteria bacterium]
MALRNQNKTKEKHRIRLRKGDTVKVITGKDLGETGKIIRLVPEKNAVVVEGINFVKKHARRTREDRQGGIHEIEAPINVSNLMLICPKCKKPTRIGHIILSNGKKVRSCRVCGEVVDKG